MMDKPEVIKRLWAAIMAGTADNTPLGIPAIDDAVPYLTGHRIILLATLRYLMEEPANAAEVGANRASRIDEAEAHLRKAAELLEEADNAPLATLVKSLTVYMPSAKTGIVYPDHLSRPDSQSPEWAMILMALTTPDALSSIHSAKGGKPARDANVIKTIARLFPDSQEFLSASNGYSLIKGLAELCGMEKLRAPSYVRAVLESGKASAKRKVSSRRPDNSIIGLLSGNKPV
ncbi:MAG: hypothetical protein AB7C98_09030 [Acidithiobacillus sp.]